MIATSLVLHAGMASVLAHIVVESPGRAPTGAFDDEVVFDLSIRSTVLRHCAEELESVVPTAPPELLLAPIGASAAEAPIADATPPIDEVDAHHVERETDVALAARPDVAALEGGPSQPDTLEPVPLVASRAEAHAPASADENVLGARPLNVTAAVADAPATTLAAASTNATSAVTTDAQPASESNPAPEYPRAARKKGWQGTVLLRVDVSADGRTTAVEIAESSGHRVLDEAARDAVRDWRFRPARRAGVAVPGRVEIPITFRLQGSTR